MYINHLDQCLMHNKHYMAWWEVSEEWRVLVTLAFVLKGGHLESPSLHYAQWCSNKSPGGNWTASGTKEMDVGM